MEVPMTLYELLWASKEEHEAIIPGDPRKGQAFRFPETLMRRISLEYGARTWPFGWHFRDGKLEGTVEEATNQEIRVRIEGYSKTGMQQPIEECACAKVYNTPCPHWGTDMNWYGQMKIDRQKKKVVEFTLAGLGETFIRWDRAGNVCDCSPDIKRYPMVTVVDLASDCITNKTDWPVKAAPRYTSFGYDYWGMWTK